MFLPGVVLVLLAAWRVFVEPLHPPAWPLAVSNPNLNTWYMYEPNPLTLNNGWPNLWNRSITGWYCGVLVDGTAYRLMGGGGFDVANQTSIDFTPSRTAIQMQAGPVNVTLNFLSPVNASDLTRQSLPFSYFYVTVASADDVPHNVLLYSDVTAEWITSDLSLHANTTADIPNDVVILQASLQEQPVSNLDAIEFPQNSTSFYALKNGAGVRYEVGLDTRSDALNSTGLQNTIDPNASSHPISSPFDLFVISVDLGDITAETPPVVWVIGVVRDPSVLFARLSEEAQLRSPYYRMNFTTPHDMNSFFLNDFDCHERVTTTG